MQSPRSIDQINLLDYGHSGVALADVISLQCGRDFSSSSFKLDALNALPKTNYFQAKL